MIESISHLCLKLLCHAITIASLTNFAQPNLVIEWARDLDGQVGGGRTSEIGNELYLSHKKNLTRSPVIICQSDYVQFFFNWFLFSELVSNFDQHICRSIDLLLSEYGSQMTRNTLVQPTKKTEKPAAIIIWIIAIIINAI